MRCYGYENGMEHLKEESLNKNSYISSLPSDLLSTISKYISYQTVSSKIIKKLL